MRIYTLNRRGIHHKVFGEDFLLVRKLSKRFHVCAVMDGCSSGKESHFISTAYGKSIHKSCSILSNLNEINPQHSLEKMGIEDIGKFVLKQLFHDVIKLKQLFYLQPKELLSTIILLVLDLEMKHAWICISGDGIVSCNYRVEDFDQNNVPDYLGYHLAKKFSDWYSGHTIQKEYKNVSDISISTDGIQKMQCKGAFNEKEVIKAFLMDHPSKEEPDFLSRVFESLVNEKGFVPNDDIGIVRIIV